MLRGAMRVTGLDALLSCVTRLARGLADATPMLREIQGDLEERAQKRFASEGASDGARWRPLSPPYKRYKDARWPGRTILTREGTLPGSLGAPGGGSGGIRVITPTSLEFGSAVSYAAFHRKSRNPLPEPTGADVERWHAGPVSRFAQLRTREAGFR